jgi:hypothetical protein
MKQLTITHSTPRVIPSEVSFSKEPFGKWFFTYFFAITSFGVWIIWLYIMPIVTPLLRIISTISIYWIIQMYKRKKRRDAIFIHGAIISGTVKERNKTFSLFKSRPDYTATLQIEVENTSHEHRMTISHSYSEDYPIGSTLVWLYYNKEFLFPLELWAYEFIESIQ